MVLTRHLAVITVLAALGGCYKYDPLYCAKDDDCADLAGGYRCDTTGAIGGIANTCVHQPESEPDASSEPDAGADATVDAPPLDPAAPDLVAQLAGEGKIVPRDVAVSADGQRIAIAGYFSGSIRIDGAEVTAAGDTDIVIALFDGAGTALWTRTFGAGRHEDLHGVAIDARGDVLVAGGSVGQYDIGAHTITDHGGSDAVIAKLRGSDGAPQWARSIGGAGFDAARDVAVDSAGNAFLAGYLGPGSVDVDFGGMTRSFAAGRSFIARYDADGELAWVHSFGGPNGAAWSVAVDPGDAVVVAGGYDGEISLGTLHVTTTGNTDVFVLKLTDDGAPVWVRSYGGSGEDAAWDVASGGPDGRISLVGYFASRAAIGGDTFMQAGPTPDAFVLSLTPTGNPLWARAIDHNYDYYGNAVAVDSRGRTRVAGQFHSGVDFGGGPVAVAGNMTDFFLGRWSTTGTLEELRHWGGADGDAGTAVSAAASGHVVAAGYFSGAVDFDGHPRTASGVNPNGVMLRLRP